VDSREGGSRRRRVIGVPPFPALINKMRLSRWTAIKIKVTDERPHNSSMSKALASDFTTPRNTPEFKGIMIVSIVDKGAKRKIGRRIFQAVRFFKFSITAPSSFLSFCNLPFQLRLSTY
jgi:hypothetical protein